MTQLSSESDATICVLAGHPSLAGHFPGNPVVPGVVLLSKVLEEIQQTDLTGPRVTKMSGVKFLAYVRPGEIVRLRFMPIRPSAVRFEGHRGSDLVISGTLEIQATSTKS